MLPIASAALILGAIPGLAQQTSYSADSSDLAGSLSIEQIISSNSEYDSLFNGNSLAKW